MSSPAPQSSVSNTRFPWLPTSIGYGLSLCVLALQLLSLHGSDFAYGGFLILHAAVFWLLAARVQTTSRVRGNFAFVAGGIVIGAIPFQPTLTLVVALIGNDVYDLSNLTQNLPIAIRVLYEIALYPAIQTTILLAAMSIGRSK